MFLKRIEMQGFKSFADKTVISFEHPVTGVVGPNGCGKSNIADAVRWVLGEQSAKSMRGEKMNDVIFAGSADRRRVNMAEVTLVFDNSSHILKSDADELEVTRRLFRDSGDAQYMINRKIVRLRDIVELFLDTGLGKDSLSIISQGNVISFAEAKPLERRGIFEEAAGVAAYKKRKLESLSRLSRTQENLDRSADILAELEKQVSPLKRAAHKAELYREKKNRLEQIEISVLVNDIDSLNADIEEAKKTLFDIDTRIQICQTEIQIGETRLADGRKTVNILDRQINDLQDELMSNLNEVQMLEGRKIELDEKRKYIVETGTREQQAAQLREMLDTAKFELDDRQARLDELTRDIQLLSTQLTNAASDLAEKRSAREAALIRTRNLESRKNMLEQLARNPFNSQAGVRAVMEHRQALSGIIGVVGQMIKVENGYEEAISTALGGLMNEIITKDEQSARDAIRFLYRNQSGRARFRPVTTCQPRRISRENLIICQNTEGFLGPASQFVSCEERIQPVVDSYLGNVPVVKDLETGNSLYHLTGGAYQIVTLTGEVIHRGGSMTGGRLRGNNANIVTMHKELEDVKAAYDAAQAEVSLKIKETDRADALVRKTTETLQNRRYAAASLEPIVDAKKAKYEKLRAEYSLLDTEEDTAADETHIDELVVELNKAYQRRDTLTTEIRSKRDQRMSMMQDNERKEAQLRQSRKDLSTAEASANAVRIDQTRLETKLENAVSRLSSEYRMTYEFAKSKEIDEPVENAREEVARLREEIMRLGKINENAPEEYNEVNGRYETLKGQIAELTASRDKILKAIDEMDQVMTKQFMEMFAAINKEFDVIFRHLYGGGKAMLVLQDPSDILNCGIDINAQPPGKAVQNNMLFSGGEKSLIALCVLFAILKVKPVPLVILDEVEAALDPGNVERFAQYLHNYTHQTQFIIVTHRPGTMENADVLYGVTMQQQGVSQMLKVELREAISMAEPTPTEVSNGVS